MPVGRGNRDSAGFQRPSRTSSVQILSAGAIGARESIDNSGSVFRFFAPARL
jgi:hypothetical protein